MTDLIEVTVRDRNGEAPWGSGPTNPLVRKVKIAATCPQCGGPRGERGGLRQHDDGVTYWVETWKNPCGHVDSYAAVIREAAEIAKAVSA